MICNAALKCQSSLFIKYYLQSKLENLVPEKITLSTWLFYRNFHTLLSCKQRNSAINRRRRKIYNILRQWFSFRIRFYAVSVYYLYISDIWKLASAHHRVTNDWPELIFVCHQLLQWQTDIWSNGWVWQYQTGYLHIIVAWPRHVWL